MHGASSTSNAPVRNSGSSGSHNRSAATSKGTATKFAVRTAPRKRMLDNAWRNAINGTCKKVTNSMKPSKGSIAGASAAVPGCSHAKTAASTTAAK